MSNITTNNSYFLDQNSFLEDSILPEELAATLSALDDADRFNDENTQLLTWKKWSGAQSSQIVFGRLQSSLGNVEKDKKQGAYRFYIKEYKYSLLLPKNFFDLRSKVNFSVQYGDTRQPLAQIDIDYSTSTQWDIYPIELNGLRFTSGNLKKKFAELVLSQDNEELLSENLLVFKQNDRLRYKTPHIRKGTVINNDNSEILWLKNISNNSNSAALQDEEISALIYCEKRKIEKHPSLGLLQFYKRAHVYFLTLQRDVFDPQIPVDLELNFNGKREPLLSLYPDLSSPEGWSIYPIFLSSVTSNFGRTGEPVELVLTQGPKSLMTQPILLYLEKKQIQPTIRISEENVPTLQQVHAISPTDEQPVSYEFGWSKSEGGSIQGQIRDAKELIIPIEPVTQLLELCKTNQYLVSIPNNYFDASRPVRFEILFDNKLLCIADLDANSRTNSDIMEQDTYLINIAPFQYYSGPTNRPAELILSQDEKTLTSHQVLIRFDNTALMRPWFYQEEESETAISPVLNSLETEDPFSRFPSTPPSEPMNPLTLETQLSDDARYGLGWWKSAGDSVYGQIQEAQGKSIPKEFHTDFLQLYKTNKYLVFIPNDYFDPSRPVNFGMRLGDKYWSIFSITRQHREIFHSVERDVYLIDISKFPYNSGTAKKPAEIILSQDDKTLTSYHVLIRNVNRTKHRDTNLIDDNSSTKKPRHT